MNMRQITNTLLVCALCAGCSPSSDFDSEIYHERDDQNILWTWQGGWGAWAQELDQDDLISALGDGGVATYAGTLQGATCYEITGSPVWTCSIDVDGVTLLGQPITQLAHTPDDCAPLGPWTSTRIDSLGNCYGDVGPLSVRLDLDRPLL